MISSELCKCIISVAVGLGNEFEEGLRRSLRILVQTVLKLILQFPRIAVVAFKTQLLAALLYHFVFE
jgi:hypothetical protein